MSIVVLSDIFAQYPVALVPYRLIIFTGRFHQAFSINYLYLSMRISDLPSLPRLGGGERNNFAGSPGLETRSRLFAFKTELVMLLFE